MKAQLRVVDNELPEPPYPKETRAGSFPFDIEVDRMTASDTWALLNPEIRPWALMSWVMSWQQTPCGSWPDNDDVIAARLGCDKKWLAVHREDILRGWKRHSDGRLYHPLIVEKVQAFLHTREKWKSKSKQKRNTRQSENQILSPNVSGDAPGTLGGLSGESLPSSSFSSSSSSSVCLVPNGTKSESLRASRADPVPYKKILELWAELCGHLPQPAKLSEARKRLIRARWCDELPDLDAWREAFTMVAESDFLSGRVQTRSDRKPFVATLPWVVKQENLLKLYEGKYDG